MKLINFVTMNLLPIMKKESLQLLRDRYTVVLILLCPILYMLIFSLTTTIDINRIKVAAFAPASMRHEVAGHMAAVMGNPLFEYVGMLGSLDEGRDMMIGDRINAILVFPAGFGAGDDRIQILTDAANPFIGATAGSYLSSALSKAGGASVGISVKMLHNPGLLSIFFFGPGFICYAMLYFIIVMVAASFAKEKETGTVYSLVASPAGNWEILAGKSIPFIAVGVIIFFCCLAVGHWVLGIPMAGPVTGVLALVIVFLITTVLLGIAISTFADSQANAIVLTSSAIALPVVYFCGIYSPVENMPEWAQQVSKVFYVSWFMDALRKMMIEGQSLLSVWRDVAWLSASAVLFALIDHFRMKSTWLG